MQALATFKVLVQLSIRNLFSHKVKTLIVGFIMLFGTFLVVLGTALLDSVETSMAKSITSSLAGHLQVYDKNARDSLALFGRMSMGVEDIGRIQSFERVKKAIAPVSNVEAIIPMGINTALTNNLGELDRALGELRRAVHEKKEAEYPVLAGQIRQIAKLLEEQLKNEREVAKDKAKIEHGLTQLARARSDAFWSEEFAKDPITALELLDTEIAPLAADAKVIFFRYLGTDLDLFAKNFDRFEIVKGQMVPTGKRGFLFNKKFYEDQIKHRVARELDFIKTAIVDQERKPEHDGVLKAKISQLPRQYQRITFQLDAEESAEVERELAKKFPASAGKGLDELIKEFLKVDEANITERHRLFYDLIAPKVQLYDVNVGDTITIRDYTKSGYLKAINIKVYGIFQFRGLDRSDIAGNHNLIDILTFRDLYGYMTEERKKEIDTIRGDVGVKEVGRASAEDELFGGGGELVTEHAQGTGFDEFERVNLAKDVVKSEVDDGKLFDQLAIDDGVALNAAIILKDPTKILETAQAIRAVIEKEQLDVQVVDWEQASGIVGQLIIVVRIVLYVAIAIIFTVALVIINNSMITATMERVTEIGTMRAIGAQRSLVLFMFLLETIVLGLVAGVLGAASGAGVVALLGDVGIPAPQDVLVFLFGGPRLYPTFGISNLIVALVAILFVSIVSTLYPARIATRIQPVVAMQRKG